MRVENKSKKAMTVVGTVQTVQKVFDRPFVWVRIKVATNEFFCAICDVLASDNREYMIGERICIMEAFPAWCSRTGCVRTLFLPAAVCNVDELPTMDEIERLPL